MRHYVCTGTCGGVAEVPGVCQTPDCPRYHEPLAPCDCADGQHRDMVELAPEPEDDEDDK